MASFDKIKEGQILYDCKLNTRFGGQKWSVWPVRVIEINKEKRTALCSWNHNKPMYYTENSIRKLKVKEPKQ